MNPYHMYVQQVNWKMHANNTPIYFNAFVKARKFKKYIYPLPATYMNCVYMKSIWIDYLWLNWNFFFFYFFFFYSLKHVFLYYFVVVVVSMWMNWSHLVTLQWHLKRNAHMNCFSKKYLFFFFFYFDSCYLSKMSN